MTDITMPYYVSCCLCRRSTCIPAGTWATKCKSCKDKTTMMFRPLEKGTKYVILKINDKGKIVRVPSSATTVACFNCRNSHKINYTTQLGNHIVFITESCEFVKERKNLEMKFLSEKEDQTQKEERTFRAKQMSEKHSERALTRQEEIIEGYKMALKFYKEIIRRSRVDLQKAMVEVQIGVETPILEGTIDHEEYIEICRSAQDHIERNPDYKTEFLSAISEKLQTPEHLENHISNEQHIEENDYCSYYNSDYHSVIQEDYYPFEEDCLDNVFDHEIEMVEDDQIGTNSIEKSTGYGGAICKETADFHIESNVCQNPPAAEFSNKQNGLRRFKKTFTTFLRRLHIKSK